MQTIYGIDKIGPELHGGLITIGNFDGIHQGHRRLLNHLAEEARREGTTAIVITFDPHPKMLIYPEKRPFYLLTTLAEKLTLLEDCGLDAVIVIPFSLAYARTTAHDFICNFLWGKLQIRGIIIGHDYTFGNRKEGNEALLLSYGGKLGFRVEVINAFSAGETIISSTRIRQAILKGDMGIARSFLGRPYNIAGRVVEGHHRGAALGFPTANIKPEKELIPPDGVYAVYVKLGGAEIDGLMNIGTNPTFGDETRSLEVYLLDFDANIYGERLDVFFIERIRGEIKFPGVEQLREQIRLDVKTGRELLGCYHQTKTSSPSLIDELVKSRETSHFVIPA
ncbi:MAG: bifunctional riboflavin kinase/FAD synthetase [Smithellaceae bacterium]|nr:bifunctional riboflavin kinase/FAD synthetase [Smithellaceae bacterium]